MLDQPVLPVGEPPIDAAVRLAAITNGLGTNPGTAELLAAVRETVPKPCAAGTRGDGSRQGAKAPRNAKRK